MPCGAAPRICRSANPSPPRICRSANPDPLRALVPAPIMPRDAATRICRTAHLPEAVAFNADSLPAGNLRVPVTAPRPEPRGSSSSRDTFEGRDPPVACEGPYRRRPDSFSSPIAGAPRADQAACRNLSSGLSVRRSPRRTFRRRTPTCPAAPHRATLRHARVCRNCNGSERSALVSSPARLFPCLEVCACQGLSGPGEPVRGVRYPATEGYTPDRRPVLTRRKLWVKCAQHPPTPRSWDLLRNPTASRPDGRRFTNPAPKIGHMEDAPSRSRAYHPVKRTIGEVFRVGDSR